MVPSRGLEQHQGSISDGKHSDANNKTNKKASSKETVCKKPSQIYEKGNLLVPEHSMCIKMHKKTTYGPQMAILPIQQQLNDGSTIQGIDGLKLHHSNTVDRKCLKANIKTIKNVSEQRRMCNAPSIVQKGGDLPVFQQPTHSKTCNRSIHGPQLAVSSSLLEGSSSQSLDRMERCVGDAIYEKHLNMNIRPIKKLMKSSEEREEQDEYEYSPVEEPKVPDKKAWCTRKNEHQIVTK